MLAQQQFAKKWLGPLASQTKANTHEVKLRRRCILCRKFFPIQEIKERNCKNCSPTQNHLKLLVGE